MKESENEKRFPVLSIQALWRIPSYLQYLKNLQTGGSNTVSAARVADHFGFTQIQVRKDFAAISSSGGRPKSGFSLNELIEDMEQYLGFRNTNEAVLIGAGSLGHALLSYSGFDDYGLKIIAAFDSDPDKISTDIHGRVILPSDQISSICHRMQIHIGIITVPAEHAQEVCDQLVAGGIRAVWNFAPVHLKVPDGILVQNENMALSLALLSRHLKESLEIAEKPGGDSLISGDDSEQ